MVTVIKGSKGAGKTILGVGLAEMLSLPPAYGYTMTTSVSSLGYEQSAKVLLLDEFHSDGSALIIDPKEYCKQNKQRAHHNYLRVNVMVDKDWLRLHPNTIIILAPGHELPDSIRADLVIDVSRI